MVKNIYVKNKQKMTKKLRHEIIISWDITFTKSNI